MSDISEGRAKGGRARAAALSPERRREIAWMAAQARWGEPRPPTAPKPRRPSAMEALAAERDALIRQRDTLVAENALLHEALRCAERDRDAALGCGPREGVCGEG